VKKTDTTRTRSFVSQRLFCRACITKIRRVAFFSPPREKRRAEARRAHLLTRAHGDRVPGRHSTHEATATMSQMVRVVAPARATATFSSLARKPRWRATRVGSPPERTKRVARLSSRTLHWLTHRASVLPSRRSKHTGEDHAEAAGRHGGGLRRAGAFPAFRAMRGVSTRLGNAEPRPSRSFLTRTPPRRSGTEAKARTTPTTTRKPKGTTSSRRAARPRSS